MIQTLKNLREAKGISQKDFAVSLGVTESAVSHWESRRYLPTTDKLKQISEILGVTMDELMAALLAEPEGVSDEAADAGTVRS